MSHEPEPEIIHAVLSGIYNDYQGILDLFSTLESAVQCYKQELTTQIETSNYTIPGGPAQAIRRNGVIEVVWDKKSLTTGYSIVKCKLLRGGASTGTQEEGSSDRGSERGVPIGRETPDERLHVVYELRTYKILGVYDDAGVANVEAAKIGEYGMVTHTPFHHT
ncbi:MAG: hypothetical protein Q9169_002720 [Polycauliona sp. 2 TL-2023]